MPQPFSHYPTLAELEAIMAKNPGISWQEASLIHQGVELGGGLSSSRGKLSIQQDLGRIAGRFGNLKCVEAANAMQSHLTRNGRNGNVIILQFYGRGSDYIISDFYMDAREAISYNSTHRGVEYNHLVHCNVFPHGKPESQWIKSFMVANGSIPTVTRIPF